jgi:uncharacterized membrane protein YphA (DoxX/SURF4 family)
MLMVDFIRQSPSSLANYPEDAPTTNKLVTFYRFIRDFIRSRNLDLAKLPISHKLIWLSRICIGVLFCYSGFIKANDFTGFAYKLDEYFEVFAKDFHPFFESFIPYSKPIACFLSVFEIALGVALMVGYRILQTVWTMLGLMVFFTFLTWYSWHYEVVQDCGCFGDALHLEPVESFMKDLILLLMLIPIFLVRRYILPVPTDKIAANLSWFSFIGSMIFSLACYWFLPLIDYRPYKVGVDLAQCTTVEGPDGFPPCKDWDEGSRVNIKDSLNHVEEFKGKVLMIVSYDLTAAPEEEVKRTVDLANALVGSDVKVLGMFGRMWREKMEKEMIPKFKFPYECSLRDEKMVKTIMRSNPGYMLLNNGVVVKKWHYNLAPTADMIKSMVK